MMQRNDVTLRSAAQACMRARTPLVALLMLATALAGCADNDPEESTIEDDGIQESAEPTPTTPAATTPTPTTDDGVGPVTSRVVDEGAQPAEPAPEPAPAPVSYTHLTLPTKRIV